MRCANSAVLFKLILKQLRATSRPVWTFYACAFIVGVIWFYLA